MNERFGFRKEDMKLLIDPPMVASDLPTRKNMLDGLNWLVQNAKRGDILFFCFSGHGVQFRDKNLDETDRYDEAIVCCDFLPGKYVTKSNPGAVFLDDELWPLFSNLPTGVSLTCVFDCCHSGTIADINSVQSWDADALAVNSQKNIKTSIITKNRSITSLYNSLVAAGQNIISLGQRIFNLTQLSLKADIFVFSACRDNQTALDIAGRGMMSICFEDAINALNNNTNYLVLFQAAAKRCNEMRGLPRFQRPESSFNQTFQLNCTSYSDPRTIYFNRTATANTSGNIQLPLLPNITFENPTLRLNKLTYAPPIKIQRSINKEIEQINKGQILVLYMHKKFIRSKIKHKN